MSKKKSLIEKVDPEWRGQYPNLKAFYKDNYPDRFYEFDEIEYSIDSMETMDEIEAYDAKRIQQEIVRCAKSFSYFCHKYVKIIHPKKGLLPFILYKYQRRVTELYEKKRFNIMSKFRQGGLTTVTGIWVMWRCLFKLDETLIVVSKTDREAIAAGEVVRRALEELPQWLKPQLSKNNDHMTVFKDTGCKLLFCPPEAVRGRSITFLVIDEAAFIPKMNEFWLGIFPTLATGGNCIVISTANGVGNWYEEQYHAAQRAENDFNVIDIEYTEHPEYDNEEWLRSMRSQLGEKGFQQEILRSFHGSGDSFIPPKVITDLELAVREIHPIRILFEQWANPIKNISRSFEEDRRGALHIWREPIDGREYIMGVDAADGIGDDGDNSCFEIIDAATCEQIAEFYSNQVVPHIFAQICASVATMYNNAVIVVENEKSGATVLSRLEHDIMYENLYCAENVRAGIKTLKNSRPLFLEALQTRLLTQTTAIRSLRFVKELKTFIYNKSSRKPEAAKGFHDDAIIALCLALYVRDTQVRTMPFVMGSSSEVPQELTEGYKAQIYEKIKSELIKGIPDPWFEDQKDQDIELGLDINLDELFPGLTHLGKRRNDSILKEFGW